MKRLRKQEKTIPAGPRSASWPTLVSLSAVAMMAFGVLTTQWNSNLAPFFTNAPKVWEALKETNAVRYERAYEGIFSLVHAVDNLPGDGAVFCAPVFPGEPGTQNGTFFWWQMSVAMRHFCFPRKVLGIHSSLFHDDSAYFNEHFVGGKSSYSEVDFLRQQNVQWILKFNNGSVEALPLESSITP